MVCGVLIYSIKLTKLSQVSSMVTIQGGSVMCVTSGNAILDNEHVFILRVDL